MTNLRRSPVFIFVVLVLLSVLIGLSQAMTTRLTVKGGEEVTYPITLAVEDRVLIQFKAIGEIGVDTSNTLNFSISFPNSTLMNFGESSDFSYSFICDVEGEYVLHFVNNDQTVEKQVTLNYEIQHYVFGIPSMFLLVIIIVLACVGGVFAFVILGRKSY